MTMTETFTPPTEKQLTFLNKLLDERPMYRDVENLWPDNLVKLSRKMISSKIDEVLRVPKETAVAKATAALKTQTDRVTEDGMYKDPSSGQIYKIQYAVHGSNNLYAKRLTLFPESDWYTKTVRGKEVEVRAEFEYAPGAINVIKPEWKMSLEEAQAFGKLYGLCVRCSATLTLEASIERGLGPVCFGKLA